MKTKQFFVTGTDTEVGKTYVTASLLQQAKMRGITAYGLKPIASGAVVTPDGLVNQDALSLMAASAPGLSYSTCNPFCYEPAIAPHIAAESQGDGLTVELLHQNLRIPDSDLVLIEGAGGWYLPLNRYQTLAQWVVEQQMPVLLVVGLRLGCINHGILTAKAIETAGARLAGWYANVCDEKMTAVEENIRTLQAHISAPYWGYVAKNQAAPFHSDLLLPEYRLY